MADPRYEMNSLVLAGAKEIRLTKNIYDDFMASLQPIQITHPLRFMGIPVICDNPA